MNAFGSDVAGDVMRIDRAREGTQMGIEGHDLKPVRSDHRPDGQDPVEEITVPSESDDLVSSTAAPQKSDVDLLLGNQSDPGNQAVRGMVYGIGFGLLLWALLAGATVALIMLSN
jgi:hypothetical protein